jgi:hypothetical protein
VTFVDNPSLTSIQDLKVSYGEPLAWYRVPQPRALDGVFQFSGGPLYAIKCKSFPTSANPHAVSGQQLAGLEYARNVLAHRVKQDREGYTSALEEWNAILEEIAVRSTLAAAVEELNANAARVRDLRRRVVDRFLKYLRSLLVLRRFARNLIQARRLFFTPFPPFRGLDWSKRAWSLLHGPRPPKTAHSPAVLGCARA